jgi:hypothetical protein
MATMECPIWKTAAEPIPTSDMNNLYFNSPRAGGRFAINDRAAALLAQNSPPPSQLACLTTWLSNQRKLGIRDPLITFDLVQKLESLRPLSTSERIERALLYFNQNTRIGGAINITGSSGMPSIGQEADLLIVTEAISQSELVSLLKMIVSMGWLESPHSSLHWTTYELSARGWLKVEELVARLPSTTQAFVAMWFNPATDLAWNHGIEPAITDAGYRAVRIDRKEHNQKIDDEIIAEIKRSKFLVADFTCEPGKVRGGVYFEAGYAVALPIPVIWTSAKNSFDDLHFDTRQYNHILWNTPDELYRALKLRIQATIGQGPLREH